MRGHTNTHGSPAGMLEPFGHLFGCRQDECIRTGGHGPDHPVRLIVHLRVPGNLGKIETDESEEMFFIQAAKTTNTFDRVLVSQSAANRVNRIRGINDDASLPQDLCCFRDQPWLGIRGMNFEQPAHPCYFTGLTP